MARPHSLGRILADTVEVMDKKEKKELNIEIIKSKISAVKTMTTFLMGLSIQMPDLLKVIFCTVRIDQIMY